MRSVTSVRMVRTRRSAKQFARGHRGGILTTSMPASAKAASNEAANCPARSRHVTSGSGCGFVLVDQPSKDWSTTDPAQNWLGDRRFRAGWTQLEGSMRPLHVVVRGVLGQHAAEVLLPEGQHAVGQLGP